MDTSQNMDEVEKTFRIVQTNDSQKQKMKKKNVPWWSEKCKKAIKDRNKSLQVLRTTHNFPNLLAHKTFQADIKKVKKRAKREKWRRYCEKIGQTTLVSDVLGKIEK